jgi:uncharacterized protein (TIGR02246 family)
MAVTAGPGEDTIEACLDRIRSAWNAGDAHAFAAAFTEDATYVIYLGEALRGRDEIESNHVSVLTKWRKGTRMAVKVISVRSIADDAVSVLTVGGIGKRVVIPYDKVQTFIMIRREGRWMCAAFQNTEMSRRAKRLYNPASDAGLFRSWRAWIGPRT